MELLIDAVLLEGGAYLRPDAYKKKHGITTAQLHSTKPKLRFCASSNPIRGLWKIGDGEDLWQWSKLE